MTVAATGRRAPRLGPDDLLAPHMTRVGRFRKVDPTRPGRVPGPAAVLGGIAWAVLLFESFRRARRTVRSG